ncbi:hypothetical protein HP1_124 [Candidatus Termititenax spirochaetophilus]|uniref:Uncharacterized protein n=1 Tax=Candidatus Termititenax spirochaetophilus TaxID=2218522 RepID=A0A388T7D3_9BACT|nr:hypothetical protein HP1_124 [Candidatus Termititenax spirochaetophilus]
MDTKKLEAMLVLLVPQVVEIIAKEHHVDAVKAAENFYRSKVYGILEQEETKLWHLSALTLFNMYDEEVKTGKFTFPEDN